MKDYPALVKLVIKNATISIAGCGIAWALVENSYAIIGFLIFLPTSFYVFIQTPSSIATLLVNAPWASGKIRIFAYVAWASSFGIILAPEYSDYGLLELKLISEYVNGHGWFMILLILASLICYALLRYSKVEGCEIYPYMPQSVIFLLAILDSQKYLDLAHSTSLFLAYFVSIATLTITVFIGVADQDNSQ